MTSNSQGIRRFLIGAVAPMLTIALLVPAELSAGRPSGAKASGGGGSKKAASSGSSVRQSHVQSSGGANVNRSSVQNKNVNKNTVNSANINKNTVNTTNVNRNNINNTNVNVNKNTNINVNKNTNVNVHGRDWEGGGNIENVYVGEEHVYIKGEEHRVWVGGGEVHVYEDYEGWRLAAGVVTGIAIGAMIASPPPHYTTVVVTGTSYYYSDGAYYSQVYNGGEVVYQVIAPPVGAVVTVLPTGCVDHRVGNVVYRNCGGYYYQPRGSSWVVVRL